MKTILIADRDSRLRNLVRLMFTESMGYRVVDTSSGIDAVLKTYDVRPDVVLADVSLSDKSGYEVSREIKNNPLLENTAVILLADSNETFDEVMAAEVYSDDFLLKPFGASEITDKLEPLLNRSKGKERFKLSGFFNTEKLKSLKLRSLMPVPRLTIERRVLFRSGIVVSLVTSVLLLSLAYRASGIKLSRPELNYWLSNVVNTDLLPDMPKSILPDNILKREVISLIKEENTETSDPITEVPATFPSPMPSENLESSFEPEAEKEGVKAYGWEEKGAVEKPQGLKAKGELSKPEEKPEEVVNGKRYVVKKGDSLWTISNSFDTSVDSIRVANNLESNSLDVGDVLIIPTRNGQGEPEGENREKVGSEPAENRQIAKKENTSAAPSTRLSSDSNATGKEAVTEEDTPAAVIKEEVVSKGTADVPTVQPNGEYSVQVGAFQGGETAEKIVDELVSKGYPAFIRTVYDPLKGTWHMIRIGQFRTMEEALAYGNRINEKEAIIDEVVVVTENAQESRKQLSQRPKPDELPDTIREEEAEINDLFEGINEGDFEEIEVNEPDFEQEKSRILEEIKRDKILKDIEEKVREKDVDEQEPPVEFNASDLGIENTSALSQNERQVLGENVDLGGPILSNVPVGSIEQGSILSNVSAESTEQRLTLPNVSVESIGQVYRQDYLKNVQDMKLEIGIPSRSIPGFK